MDRNLKQLAHWVVIVLLMTGAFSAEAANWMGSSSGNKRAKPTRNSRSTKPKSRDAVIAADFAELIRAGEATETEPPTESEPGVELFPEDQGPIDWEVLKTGTPFAMDTDYWVEFNAADNGVGYDGSYVSFGALYPYAHDEWAGVWYIEGRAHVSEHGNFFSNLGWGRRQLIDRTLSAGLSLWWDFDGDETENFGHSFTQLGISADIEDTWWRFRVNGYIPVGTTSYVQEDFVDNFILISDGVDAALGGADAEIGVRLPIDTGYETWLTLGGYSYSTGSGNQSVSENFSGVTGRIEAPILDDSVLAQLQINHDDRFETTGFANFIFRFGSARGRSHIDCSCIGPRLRRTQRNAHIVRVHEDPVLAINPATGDPWRVFHVDNTASSGGDGSVDNPFNTLEAGDIAADTDYDIIFVREGDGTTNGYNTQVRQLAGQQLLGDGVEHFIPTQVGSFQFPSDLDGMVPVITNTTDSSVVLANDSVVSGVVISGARTAIEADATLTSGTATVDRVFVSGGQTGIDLQDVTGGVAVTDSTLNDTTTRSVNIEGGAPIFSFAGDIINGQGLLFAPVGIQSVRVANTGAATDISFSGTISENNGVGMLFDTVDGNVDVSSVVNITNTTDRGLFVNDSSGTFQFDDLTVTTNSNAPGVDLTSNTTATIGFDSLDVTTSNGTGLRAIDSGTVNVGSGTIVANAGPAVDMQNTTVGVTFNNLTSSNSVDNGVNLDTVTGSFTVLQATTVNSSAGHGINVENSPALVADFGSVNINGSGLLSGNGVNLVDNAGSTFTFSNPFISSNGAGIVADNIGMLSVTGGSINTTLDGIRIDDADASIVSTVIASGADGIDVMTQATDQTVTIDQVTITSAGTQGIRFNTNGAGNLTASVNNSSVTSTGDAFNASTTGAGNIELAVNDSTFASTSGAGMDVDGSVGGTITVTQLANNTITGSGTGTGGMLFNTVTFDADTSTGAIEQVDAGNTVIGTTANRVEGDGLRLLDPTGDLRFSRLDIANNNGTGLLVEAKATTFNLDNSSGTIDTTNGAAMDLDPLSVDITLESISSTGSSGNGVRIDEVTGTINVGTTTISDATGTGILIENSPGLVADFGDTTISTSGSQGDGVTLNSNSGAAITFNNLSIATSSGTGFSATDTGTVDLTGTDATISATGGAAVEIDALSRGETDGAAGWTFASLSSTNSSGAGISLDGALDNFTVTGATTISNSTDTGISILDNDVQVEFNTVSITAGANTLETGIELTGTGDFALNSTSGSSSISGTQTAGISADNLSDVTINDTTFTTTDGEGIDLNVDGTNTMTAVISNNTVNASLGQSLNGVTAGTATMDITLTGNEATGINKDFTFNNGSNLIIRSGNNQGEVEANNTTFFINVTGNAETYQP